MKDEDLEVTCTNPRAQGGQQVTVTQWEVCVKHKPTGIYACSKVERSQHRNRELAKQMVEYGLAVLGWKDEATQTPEGK